MSTPAGWYPDPERPGTERWWDGQAWGQIRPAAETPAAPGPAPERQGPGLRQKIIAGIVLTIVALAIIGTIAGGDDEATEATTTTEADSILTTTTTTTPPTAEEQFEAFVADELDGQVDWVGDQPTVIWDVFSTGRSLRRMADTLEEAQRLDLGTTVRFSAWFTFTDDLGRQEDREGFWLEMPWDITEQIVFDNFDPANIFDVAGPDNYSMVNLGLREDYLGE